MYCLSSICFMCLDNNNLQKLFKENEDDTVQQVTFVLPEIPIFLESSKIPVHICSKCQTKLESFYTFKKMCLENYSHLTQDIKMLQESSDAQDHSELQIRVNNEKLRIKEEPNMDIDIKEDIEDPMLASEETDKPTNFEYVKCEALDEVQDESSNVPSINEDEAKMNSDETSTSTNTISVRNINSLKKSTDKEFKCTVCSKKFSTNSILKRHMRIHQGIFNFVCSKCGKKFSQSSQLKYHMKVHLDIKDQECSICDKKFRSRSELKIHLKIHLGIRDHKCTFCKKKYTAAQHLKKHMRTQHSVNNS